VGAAVVAGFGVVGAAVVAGFVTGVSGRVFGTSRMAGEGVGAPSDSHLTKLNEVK